MNSPENIVPLFDASNPRPATKRQIQDRVIQLAMVDSPPLSHGMIALIVRNDFDNAKTSNDSVASTLSKLPADLKLKLPANRPRTPQRFR